jgi:hypothetical protein
MMEAIRTSETLIYFYEITRSYDPEGSHLHARHRENLVSHNQLIFGLQLSTGLCSISQFTRPH